MQQIYANLFKITKNTSSSLSTDFYLVALSGRTKFGTPSFQTEFRNFAPFVKIIYAN